MIMRNVEKIRKQKNSPGSGIIIKSVVQLAGLAAVIGLIHACGVSFSLLLGIYLGYRVLRLVMRMFRLLMSLVFTLVSIFIIIVIISLLII
jgi:hypothetical protein